MSNEKHQIDINSTEQQHRESERKIRLALVNRMQTSRDDVRFLLRLLDAERAKVADLTETLQQTRAQLRASSSNEISMAFELAGKP